MFKNAYFPSREEVQPNYECKAFESRVPCPNPWPRVLRYQMLHGAYAENNRCPYLPTLGRMRRGRVDGGDDVGMGVDHVDADDYIETLLRYERGIRQGDSGCEACLTIAPFVYRDAECMALLERVGVRATTLRKLELAAKSHPHYEALVGM